MPSDPRLPRRTLSRFFYLQKRDKGRGSHWCRCPRRFFPAWVLPLQISALRRAGIGFTPRISLSLLDVPSRVKPEGISNTCEDGHKARNAVGFFARDRLCSRGGGCPCPCASRVGGRAPGRGLPARAGRMAGRKNGRAGLAGASFPGSEVTCVLHLRRLGFFSPLISLFTL